MAFLNKGVGLVQIVPEIMSLLYSWRCKKGVIVALLHLRAKLDQVQIKSFHPLTVHVGFSPEIAICGQYLLLLSGYYLHFCVICFLETMQWRCNMEYLAQIDEWLKKTVPFWQWVSLSFTAGKPGVVIWSICPESLTEKHWQTVDCLPSDLNIQLNLSISSVSGLTDLLILGAFSSWENGFL